MTASELIFLRRLANLGKLRFDFQVVIGFYIADFLLLDKMLIIELDGRHHSEQTQRTYDKRRDGFLCSYGFTVWRLPNTDVKTFDMQKILDYPDKVGSLDAIHKAGRLRDGKEHLLSNQEICEEFFVRVAAGQSPDVADAALNKAQQPPQQKKPRLIKRHVEDIHTPTERYSHNRDFELALEKDRS